MSVSELPRIGFVVIGRNEGARLDDSLGALRPFGRPIVYADSGSTDDSVERAARSGATVVELDAARPMNAARGRKEGFARLLELCPTIEFVQFLDGDCILQPGWIETALEFLAANPQAAVACGRRFEAKPDTSVYNRLCDTEWNTPVGLVAACGGDAVMRVTALQQAGGFDPRLSASEEPELCARLRALGWQIWRLDCSMTEHDANILRFGQSWRRSFRGGFGYAQAWAATASLPRRINSDLLIRAFGWAFAMPVAVTVLAIIARRPVLLFGIPILFAAQIARVAVKLGPTHAFSWQRASLLMILKVAEAMGAMRFFIRRRPPAKLDYKAAHHADGAGSLLDGRLSFGLPEAILLTLAGIAVAVWVAISSA